MNEERMNADEPRPDHCGPSCPSWSASEDRCGMLNEREQRINRHGNVGYFPDHASRNAFFRGHPCQPYGTLLNRLLATPMLRRPSAHETQDAAHQVLHGGIGRWLEGRAPLRIVANPKGAGQRETVWRHDAVLLSSRWPYYYLFRDELRRTLDDRAKAMRSAADLGDDLDGPATRDADALPSPLAGPEEKLSAAQTTRQAASALDDLVASVARLDPVGAAMLADPEYPEIDTARHAAALAADYARMDALDGKPRSSPRKATPTDVTHRRHLAELRAAVLGSSLLERLSARHQARTVASALAGEERRTQALSRLLQGYLRAFDREGLFDTFGLQQAFAAALETAGDETITRAPLDPAAFVAAGQAALALGESAATAIEAGEGEKDRDRHLRLDAEALRVRAKKLRASARKLGKFVERMAELLSGPVAARPFEAALSALRDHAFRPFDPTDRGPFTKLGLPASGTSAEGAQLEGLLTAACLTVLSGLLDLRGGPRETGLRGPRRELAPRNAVRLLNVLLRDFAVALGPSDDDGADGSEGDSP